MNFSPCKCKTAHPYWTHRLLSRGFQISWLNQMVNFRWPLPSHYYNGLSLSIFLTLQATLSALFLPVGVHGCIDAQNLTLAKIHVHVMFSLHTALSCTVLASPLRTTALFPHHNSYAFCNPTNSLFTVTGNSSLFHLQANFSVGMKQHTITNYIVRLHYLHMTSYYFQRPLEEAR